MSASFQNHTPVIYLLDEVKKTFRQYRREKPETDVSGCFLPEVIRIERNTGYNTFTGFNHILRLRDASNWSLCTLLGLKPSGIRYFYSVDLFNKETKNLCIVHYPKEGNTVELYLFPEFYPCKKSLIPEKITEIIQGIIQKKEI